MFVQNHLTEMCDVIQCSDFSGHARRPLVALKEALNCLANRENNQFEFVDTVSLYNLYIKASAQLRMTHT